MPWLEFNPNPKRKRTGDCAIRAVAAALDVSWDDSYILLCLQGLADKDLPNTDAGWGAVLEQHGFRRGLVEADCQRCYTLRDFAIEHPHGTFVVSTHEHVICVRDGSWWDTWDSADERPIYYFHKE